MEDFAIITPDFLTPQQWTDLHRRALDPIHRLMFAVLMQAVGESLAIKRSSGSHRAAKHQRSPATIRFIARRASRRRQSAIDWVNDSEATGVFSFNEICAVLEIDSEKLRNRVRGDGGAAVVESHRAAA